MIVDGKDGARKLYRAQMEFWLGTAPEGGLPQTILLQDVRAHDIRLD